MNKKIKFRVNGKTTEVEVPTNRMLIDCLRYDLGLTGTKEGCSVGVCGACTVLMDGDMISSCLTLAVMADGHELTTVEGSGEKWRAQPGAKKLHPVRRFSVRHLHPRPGGRGHCVAERKPQAQRRRDQGLDDGQPVPLHGLLQDHRIDPESSSIRQIIRTQP